MKCVITPVGTSLFTNGAQYNSDIADFFSDIEVLYESDWDNCTDEIANLRTASEGFIAKVSQTASAELQSTKVIQDKLNDEIVVYLLASDTIASRLAAEILKDQINPPNSVLGNNVTAKFNPDPGTSSQIDVIRNLQVKNSTDFSTKGMPNLFQRITYIKDWEAGGSQNLAINITGGYGATLPYLAIFAQLEGVPLYYNFEGETELITIPRVPLAIDLNLIESHASVLAKIADHMDDSHRWRRFKKENEHVVKELDAFIWEDDSLGAELSPMGNIFWNEYLKSHFVVELPCCKYSGYPNHDYYKMNSSQKSEINNAIQDLYRRLKLVLGSPFPDSEACYTRIRDLDHNDDLNHTGQVEEDIFIFKGGTGHNNQIRMLYTFKVSNQVIRVITIFAILYHQYQAFDHTTYYEEWREQFNRGAIDFSTCTFDI